MLVHMVFGTFMNCVGKLNVTTYDRLVSAQLHSPTIHAARTQRYMLNIV